MNYLPVAFLWSLLLIGNLYAQSELKLDERIVFFPTAASLSSDKTHWEVPVHAWVHEASNSLLRRKAIEYTFRSKYRLKNTSETKSTFDYRVGLLLVDNERSKRIQVRMGERVHELPLSKENGHTEIILQIPESEIRSLAKGATVPFQAVLPEGDMRVFSGEVLLIPPSGISVISDIDDTIKESSVLDRKKLFEYTFYQKFIPVKGMAQFYQKLAREKAAQFHFVSSSPWHLFEPLHQFAEENSFPHAEYHLKGFRFKDKTLLNLFEKGTKTKIPIIRGIMERFPQRQFILIGDSGEQDPEVYASIMKEFPDQVLRCFIRSVANESADDERFRAAFKAIPKEKWQLFSDASELQV